MTNPPDTSATGSPGEPAGPDFREVLVLDDAELAALDGPGVRTLAPLHRHPATEDGLWWRRVDEAADRLVDDGRAVRTSTGLEASAHVAKVLGARRSWMTAVLVEQQDADGWQFTVVHLRADGRALVEEVFADGRHRFLATTAGWALSQVVELVMPFDGGHTRAGTDVPAPRTRWSPTAWAEQGVASVEAAAVVSSVVVMRNHLAEGDRSTVDQHRLSVFVLPESTVVASGTADGALDVGTVDRASLLDELTAHTHLDDGTAR